MMSHFPHVCVWCYESSSNLLTFGQSLLRFLIINPPSKFSISWRFLFLLEYPLRHRSSQITKKTKYLSMGKWVITFFHKEGCQQRVMSFLLWNTEVKIPHESSVMKSCWCLEFFLIAYHYRVIIFIMVSSSVPIPYKIFFFPVRFCFIYIRNVSFPFSVSKILQWVKVWLGKVIRDRKSGHGVSVYSISFGVFPFHWRNEAKNAK